MKGIILAAGEGKRLSPLTDHYPKCMVNYNDKPIINYILDSMEQCGIEKPIIVNGYKKEVLVTHLRDRNIIYYTNENYAATNMVATLFCAEDEFDDDIIISYADIIFTNDILKKLIFSSYDVSVVVDKNWQDLWEIRMDEPLQDAETMKINNEGDIIEIGDKPNCYEDIDGQYIGLIKISKKAISKVSEFYHNLDKKATYDGGNFNNMYMTTLLQLIINKLSPVKAVLINGGWLEFDTIKDLESYKGLSLDSIGRKK